MTTKGWLDSLLDRGNEAKYAKRSTNNLAFSTTEKASGPEEVQSAPAIARPRQPKADINLVWIQTRAPAKPGDPGECAAGYYSVVDGAVIMHDESGKPTGQRQSLGPDDDARGVAGRMTLAAWRAKLDGNFNRPINYSRA